MAFQARLFNISDSGGLAAAAAYISGTLAGSPPANLWVVATPTWVINQNIMQLVILATVNPSGTLAVVGSNVFELSYEVSGDGGAALVAAMNAAHGSPAIALTKVQDVNAAQNFENLAICNVVLSN